MKFRDKRDGSILEPTDKVAAMMAGNPNFEKVEEKRSVKPTRRTAKADKE